MVLVCRAQLFRNVASAGLLGGSADLVTQTTERAEVGLDSRRFLAVTSFSAGYMGAICTVCYETLYPSMAAALGVRSVLGRGLAISSIDNFLHVPILYIPCFYAWLQLARGGTLSDARRECSLHWWESVTSCWMLWLPLQVATFTAVPPAFRVRFVAAGNFAWMIWLDRIARLDTSRPTDLSVDQREPS
jgi:hypothetical protein